MSAKAWLISRLFPGFAGAMLASAPVIRASRAIISALRKDYGDISDEKLKALFEEFESRVEKLEASVAALENSVSKLTAAVYLIAGVALAALILSVVKLA